MRALAVHLIPILAATIIVCWGCPQSTAHCLQCDATIRAAAPKYRVARKIQTTTGGLIVYVSIGRDRFTHAAMSSLACRLARDFPGDDVLVLVFDRFDSAKKYMAPWQQEKPGDWEKYQRSLRATYSHEVPKNEHWIWWDIDPDKKQKERIDLCPTKSNEASE